MKDKNIPERISLEYQKAQDSAEHYDTMVWTLISLGIVASALILYQVWSKNEYNPHGLLLLFMGAFILFYFSYLIESANEKKNLKYAVCKKIEREYNFIGQNILVEELPLAKTNYRGIRLLRIMKFLLSAIYFLAILTYGIIALSKNTMKDIQFLLIIGYILGLIAGIFMIIFEVYYARKKYDPDEIIKKK